jgi:hypothetical protein
LGQVHDRLLLDIPPAVASGWANHTQLQFI